MSDLVAVVLLLALAAYAVFGGADFGAGFWDLTAGGPERGARPARADRALDRPGLGGQPRLADLHLRRDLDGVLRGLRLDHADAVRPAHHRRARHRPARRELRVPQVGRRPCATGGSSAARSPLSSVLVPLLHGSRRRRDRLRSGARRRQGRRPGRQLAQPDVDRRPASWPSRSSAYLAAVYLVWEARRAGDAEMAEYFRRRAVVAAVVVAVVGAVGLVVLHDDAPYVFDGHDRPGAAGRRRRRASAASAPWCCSLRDAARGARVLAVVAVAGHRRRLGRRAVALPAARDASPSPTPPRRPAP